MIIRRFFCQLVFQYENLVMGESILSIQHGREERRQITPHVQQNDSVGQNSTSTTRLPRPSPVLKLALFGASLGVLEMTLVVTVSALTSCSLHFLATLASAGAIVLQAVMLLEIEQFMLSQGLRDHQDFYIPRWATVLCWSITAGVAAAVALGAGASPSVAATAGLCSAAVNGTAAYFFRGRVWMMTRWLLQGICQAAAMVAAWIARRPGPDAWGGYSGHVLCLLIAYIAYTEWRMAALLPTPPGPPPQQLPQQPVGGI